jgi:hypothetical protein
MGNESIGRSVKLTTLLQPVQRLRILGSIHPLLPTSSWHSTLPFLHNLISSSCNTINTRIFCISFEITFTFRPIATTCYFVINLPLLENRIPTEQWKHAYIIQSYRLKQLRLSYLPFATCSNSQRICQIPRATHSWFSDIVSTAKIVWQHRMIVIDWLKWMT